MADLLKTLQRPTSKTDDPSDDTPQPPNLIYRPLKGLDLSAFNPNSPLSDALIFLEQILAHDFDTNRQKFPGKYILSPQNRNEYPLVLSAEEISNLYRSEEPEVNFTLFASDLFAAANDLDQYLQQELLRARQSIESYQGSDLAAQARDEIDLLARQLEGAAGENRARVRRWSGKTITVADETQLLEELERRGFAQLVGLANLITKVVDDFRIWINKYSDVADFEPKPPEEALGDDEQTTKSASAGKGELASDESGAEETRAEEAKVEEPAPKPSTQETPPDPQEFNSAMGNFSNSFSQVVLNSLLAAYAQDENGNPLISYESLSPELQDALRRQLAPQIENIILSLSSQQLEALINGGPEASAVRLEIFRKAHGFAIGYPPLRLLLQQAVNESHAAISQQAPEKKEVLEQELNNTSHEQAAQRIEGVVEANQDQWQLGEENGSQLSTILQLRSLSPQEIRGEFELQLNKIAGKNADPQAANLARLNFETTIASLIVTDPTLTPKFVDYLDYAKVRFFIGSSISREQYGAHEAQIKHLLKQYWTVLRAELNQKNESLQQISDLSTQPPDLSEEQVNDRVHRASLIRSDLIKKSGLSGEEFIDAASGQPTNNPDLVKGEKYVEELKKSFLETTDVSQRRRYLKDVGLEDRLQAQAEQEKQAQEELSLARFKQILEESQMEFDYFRFAAIELEYQQRQSAINYALTTIAQQTAQQMAVASAIAQTQVLQAQVQAQTMMMLEHSHFLVPDQSYSHQFEGQPQPTSFAYNPAASMGPNGAVSQAEGMQAAINQQKMQTLEQLAEMGVDAALNYALPGYGAIPKPIRDFVNKAVVKESLKKIKWMLKALKAAAAAAMLLLATLAKAAQAILSTLGVLGGALTLGGIGFALGGPVGGLVGTTLGAIGGWLGGENALGSGAGSTAASRVAAESAQAGARNVSSAASGLSQAAKNQASLVSNGGSGQTVAGESAAAEAAGAGASSQVATLTLAGLGGVSAITMITATVLLGSFHIDYTSRQLTSDELQTMGVSRYASIKKEATIINSESGCEGMRKCEDPDFPVIVEYSINIEPRNGYILEINSIVDTTRTAYNPEAYAPDPTPTQDVKEEVLHETDEDPIILDDTDSDPSNNSYQITYTQEYGDEFNHALIRNKVEANISYFKAADEGSEQIKSATSVALGDAPQELLCWPNNGWISSIPFQPGMRTHQNTDAYDIASYQRPVPAYAPTDGLLCMGRITQGIVSGYGHHVTLTSSILGEEYIFVLGHLHVPSFLVADGGCVNVERGDHIGTVGTTGTSTGYHMHLEKRRESRGDLSLTELLTGDTIPVRIGTDVFSCVDE